MCGDPDVHAMADVDSDTERARELNTVLCVVYSSFRRGKTTPSLLQHCGDT